MNSLFAIGIAVGLPAAFFLVAVLVVAKVNSHGDPGGLY